MCVRRGEKGRRACLSMWERGEAREKSRNYDLIEGVNKLCKGRTGQIGEEKIRGCQGREGKYINTMNHLCCILPAFLSWMVRGSHSASSAMASPDPRYSCYDDGDGERNGDGDGKGAGGDDGDGVSHKKGRDKDKDEKRGKKKIT